MAMLPKKPVVKRSPMQDWLDQEAKLNNKKVTPTPVNFPNLGKQNTSVVKPVVTENALPATAPVKNKLATEMAASKAKSIKGY